MAGRMAIAVSPRLVLWIGALALGAAHMRWGVALFAWFAPVAFLHHLRSTTGFRARLETVAAVYVGYALATLKITTEPLPHAFALFWALPSALLFGAAYLSWSVLCRGGDRWQSVLGFPALMVTAEYAQHRLTPFASWGAAAYTQLEILPLMQVASLFGIAGVSFLVYFFAAAFEEWLSAGRPISLRGGAPLALAAASVALAFTYGTLRLELARTGETRTVAAVGTDATFGGWPLPLDEEIAAIDAGLFARTERAARAGAALVAWTEAATVVKPEREAALVERVRAAALSHAIELVAAYIVAAPSARTFVNKYVWARPDGSIDHSYLKHEPVPGEPAVRGTSAPRAVQTAVGTATGALCYDYDFPAIGLEHARLGIDLAVVPSSDWRGIDPIHTQMASVRAIEGGFSLLRSTRFGLSAGFDPYGRARAWQSSFDSGERVLLAALPTRRVATLYSTIGDAFVGVCALLVALALWLRALSAIPSGKYRPLGALPLLRYREHEHAE
jgi:apolipoprotein N-acyltransferase